MTNCRRPVRPVAITGTGCVCALGPDLPSSMEALFRGPRPPAPATRFSTTHKVPLPVFEVPERWIPSASEGEDGMLYTARLALAACRQALASAGLTEGEFSSARSGICVGTTVGSAMNNEEFYRELRTGGNPDLAPIRRYLASNPALAAAAILGCGGPCQTIANACSSGTDAVGVAASWIRQGLCDRVLAVGADELCRTTLNGFASLLIVDQSPCRPFDARRQGLNLGEGAGALLLESEDARKGRRARAFCRGFGLRSDAYHPTAPHPEGAGLRGALADALGEAGIEPGEVGFINAHGTGTPDNDRVEGQVLAGVFPGVPFLSTKGATGHTLGAAGAIEAVFTIASLELGRIPPSWGFECADPQIGVQPVQRGAAVKASFALSQSLAFGGGNGVVVFSKGDA